MSLGIGRTLLDQLDLDVGTRTQALEASYVQDREQGGRRTANVRHATLRHEALAHHVGHRDDVRRLRRSSSVDSADVHRRADGHQHEKPRDGGVAQPDAAV